MMCTNIHYYIFQKITIWWFSTLYFLRNCQKLRCHASCHSFFPPPASCPFSICHFSYVTTIINNSILPPLPHSPLSTTRTPSSFTPRFALPGLCHISRRPQSAFKGLFFLTGAISSLVGGDLQASCGTLDEGGLDDNVDWEEEREMEKLACEGDDFVPPKIMVLD